MVQWFERGTRSCPWCSWQQHEWQNATWDGMRWKCTIWWGWMQNDKRHKCKMAKKENDKEKNKTTHNQDKMRPNMINPTRNGWRSSWYLAKMGHVTSGVLHMHGSTTGRGRREQAVSSALVWAAGAGRAEIEEARRWLDGHPTVTALACWLSWHGVACTSTFF